MKKCSSLIPFIFCFIFLQIGMTQNKIHPDLIKEWDDAQIISCIIVFKTQADLSDCKKLQTKEAKGLCVYENLKENARIHQKSTIEWFHTNNVDFHQFLIVNAISAELSFDQALEISSIDEIKIITNNPTTQLEEPISTKAVQTRNEGEPEWGLKMIQADSVWRLGYTGSDVVIAGQDTGYDWDNELIVSKYRGTSSSDTIHDYNWHDAIHEINPMNVDTTPESMINPCGLNSTFPCDDHGHGTHTMGTMIGHSAEECIGVAPDSKWIACRNMERGAGTPTSYLECFEWFLAPTKVDGSDPQPSSAPHVINNSWSCPESEGCNSSNWDLMETAISNLKTAGIVVVVSAGNSGSQGCGSIRTAPAILPSSFAVGATAENDTIARFSSRGPVVIDSSFRLKPNISAPGVRVRSAILNDTLASWSGTSMAGPHVAGSVALIISANPSLAGNVEEIENILELSAVQKTDTLDCQDISGTEVPNQVYGNGRLNVLKAVELALGISSSSNIELNEKIHIFPNPSRENLFIQNPNGEKISITIHSMRGQLIDKFRVNAFQTYKRNVQGLRSGIYLISWNNGEEQGSIKWMKN